MVRDRNVTPLKSRKMVRIFITSPVQPHAGVPASTGRLGRKKGHPDWKGRYKLNQCANVRMVLIENTKEHLKKKQKPNLLELTSKFNVIARHQVNIKKLVGFLYNSNKQLFGIWNFYEIPFT